MTTAQLPGRASPALALLAQPVPQFRTEARLSAHSALRAAGIAVNPRSQRAIEIAVDIAATEGHEHGLEEGHVGGWRWGFVCGVIIGLVGAAVTLALGIQAGMWAGS